MTAGTFLMGQNQVASESTTDLGMAAEEIIGRSTDYLSQSQTDAFWYLADTAQSVAGVVYQLSKSSVYVTARLPCTRAKLEVLVCFDWHTGRVVRYQVLDSKDGEVLYTFQRQENDTFLSTEETGYAPVPIKPEKKKKMESLCRIAVISAANQLATM